MIILQSMMARAVLALFFGVLVVGCASVPNTSGSLVAVQSYDMPGTMDSNAVVDVVKRSFARVLVTPPSVTEGSVPSPLPVWPAGYTIEDRHVRLDRLGVVAIPHVGCPESMATIRGFAASAPGEHGLHSVTGCIQLYAGGYRVQIIESLVSGMQRDRLPAAGSEQKASSELVSRIARMLVEQVSEARLTHASMPEADASFHHFAMIDSDREATPRLVAASMSAPFSTGVGTDVGRGIADGWRAFPLVCLAPKRDVALVTSQPHGGRVITTWRAGSLVAVPEPIDADYFHVTTEDGPRGWVNRSDVKRLPCPVG